MKKIYIIKKYVLAESIEEALVKEKKAKVSECWLSDYSQNKAMEELQPNEKVAGFKKDDR